MKSPNLHLSPECDISSVNIEKDRCAPAVLPPQTARCASTTQEAASPGDTFPPWRSTTRHSRRRERHVSFLKALGSWPMDGDKVTAARLHAEVKVFGDCRLPFKYEVPHRFYCPTHPSCILERGKDFTRFDSFLSWCVLLTRATKFSFLIFRFFQITEKNTRLSRV